MQAPIVKNDNRFQTLRCAADLIASWSNCNRPGMTTKTSLAWTQTLRAVADLAEDLLENYSFDYFLPGKVLSDVIEARFGCYRQMSGANYFMSLRQLLDSEKKIRVLSKLQDLKAVLLSDSASDIASLEEALPRSKAGISEYSVLDVSYITDELECISSVDQVSVDDQNVIYYVSGFCGRSVSLQKKCSACRSLLLDNGKHLPLNIDEDLKVREEFSTLLQMADRGGLAKPSDYTFSISLLMYQYYSQVVSNPDLRQKFLSSDNHFRVFISIMQHMFKKCNVSSTLSSVTCSDGHTVFQFIASSLFNCFIKNLIKTLNTSQMATTADSRVTVTRKKLCKLQTMSLK